MSKLAQLDQLLNDLGYPVINDFDDASLDDASREALHRMCRGRTAYKAAFVRRGWLSWFHLYDERLWNEGGPSLIVKDVLRRAGIEIIDILDVFGENGILLDVRTTKGSWSFIVERETGLSPNDRTGFDIITTSSESTLISHDYRLIDLSGESATIKWVPVPLPVWDAVRQSKLIRLPRVSPYDASVTDMEACTFRRDARLFPFFELLRSRAWQKRRKACVDEVAGLLRPDHAGSKDFLRLALSDADKVVREWALQTANSVFSSTFETVEAVEAALTE